MEGNRISSGGYKLDAVFRVFRSGLFFSRGNSARNVDSCKVNGQFEKGRISESGRAREEKVARCIALRGRKREFIPLCESEREPRTEKHNCLYQLLLAFCISGNTTPRFLENIMTQSL